VPPKALDSDAGGEQVIDHGAALQFQYDWPGVTEASPRQVGTMPGPHLFDAVATSKEWITWDAVFASLVTRAVLESAVAAVPADFITPLLPAAAHDGSSASQADAVRRRRAAYVAFLWKRLQPPRAFADALTNTA
jgi:hypothetical protein